MWWEVAHDVHAQHIRGRNRLIAGVLPGVIPDDCVRHTGEPCGDTHMLLLHHADKVPTREFVRAL